MSDPVPQYGQPEIEPKRVPAINAPTVVLALCALMFIVHLVQALGSRLTVEWIMLHLAFIPARYDAASSLIYPGARGADVWTFVTHLFVHGGWTHLAVNGVFMLAFGSVLARRFGAFRFLVFSAFAGLGAVLVHLWAYWGDTTPLIGASGAISGQMAGTVRLMFAGRRPVFAGMQSHPVEIRALSLLEVFKTPKAIVFLTVWVLVTVLAGGGGVMAPEGSSIAWEAHLGGFAIGMLLFGLFDPGRGHWDGRD